LKVLLYGYATGVRSSRKLEQRLASDVNFMFLAGQARPDHKTISEFRRRHLAAFSALFVEVLELCAAAGLVKLGRVALDGTKLRANASKHKAMSYARMQRREAELAAEELRVLEEGLTEGARADQHDRLGMGELRGQVALDERASHREADAALAGYGGALGRGTPGAGGARRRGGRLARV
ncbi:MAG: IS5/IS1182 family transposase, partial [Solirubrobacterales bacterium]|nr:IS5/IS1182 family transposase [Solirubrobacterales bacterium]